MARVYLFSRPSLLQESVNQFLEETGSGPWIEEAPSTDADRLAELAGRICYQSFGTHQGNTKNAAYLKNILEKGHGSVLEHATWSLLLTGVSRTLTHEFIRHRAGFAYSQQSQRYVDESDSPSIEPPLIAADPHAHAIWHASILRAQADYISLVTLLSAALPTLSLRDRRIAARQAARSLLPNALSTTLLVTANARAWRHFLELRGALAAEPEIRALALLILPILLAEAPNLFSGLSAVNAADGTPYITSLYPKV